MTDLMVMRTIGQRRYSFFDHDANRRRLAIDKLNRELDQPVPSITISDYENGPVSIMAETPHPGVLIPPEGVMASDIEEMRDWNDTGLFAHGSARNRLRAAGLIKYVGKRWSVTDAGKAFL